MQKGRKEIGGGGGVGMSIQKTLWPHCVANMTEMKIAVTLWLLSGTVLFFVGDCS